MKVGDLVTFNFIKMPPPMIGIVIGMRSCETVNDIAIVWWGEKIQGAAHEYAATLRVVYEGR